MKRQGHEGRTHYLACTPPSDGDDGDGTGRRRCKGCKGWWDVWDCSQDPAAKVQRGANGTEDCLPEDVLSVPLLLEVVRVAAVAGGHSNRKRKRKHTTAAAPPITDDARFHPQRLAQVYFSAHRYHHRGGMGGGAARRLTHSLFVCVCVCVCLASGEDGAGEDDPAPSQVPIIRRAVVDRPETDDRARRPHAISRYRGKSLALQWLQYVTVRDNPRGGRFVPSQPLLSLGEFLGCVRSKSRPHTVQLLRMEEGMHSWNMLLRRKHTRAQVAVWWHGNRERRRCDAALRITGDAWSGLPPLRKKK